MRPYYVWYDEARSLQVELALPLAQQLSLTAMEAFKSLPHRGLEVGGLLLGSTRPENGRRVVSIDTSVEIASEHRSGPSYQLSAADLEVLDFTCSSHPQAVGMYRTTTQAPNLALHEDDCTLFHRHFDELCNIYLLIHPATRKAAFCLAGTDGLTIAHEFSFHPADLGANGTIPSEGLAASPSQTPTVAPSRSRTWAIRVTALCLGAVLGAFAWQRLAPPLAHTAPPPPMRVTPAAATPANTDHVALDVQRDGRVLKLTWDRRAPAIGSADRAVLHIVDGGHETNLNLTSGELSTGLLSYWAETPDVTFRLEVFGAAGQTNDSIRAVGGPQSSTNVASAAPSTPPRPSPEHQWKPAPDKATDDDEPDAVSAARSAPDPARPSPFTPPAKPEPARMEAIAAPAPAPAAAAAPANAPAPSRSTEPRVDVSAEPVTGSRLGRAVRHIPLFGRLKKNPATDPPAPLHEVKPAFSATQRHALDAEVPVDVRVYITESGKVDFAELVDTRATSRHRDLADAAVFAARRWSFKPARQGEDNVPSEAILHFRFKAEEPPAQ